MYTKMINALEVKLKELLAKQAAYEAEKAEMEISTVAYENAYDSMFDGLKFVSSYDNPMPLVLPMVVKQNVFYKAEGEGHVFVANRDGIVTEDNFDSIMEDMDAPAV